MNVYDSGRMADLMRPLGYQAVDSPDGADMVILNTCHIREKATEKLFSDLGRLKPFKAQKESRDGGRMILAVAGCVAQAEGELIAQRAPYVDMVFGPQTYHRLPEMVAMASRGSGVVLDTDFPVESKFDHLPADHGDGGSSAFLSVQEGCDKFCTFCVVPYTRGAEYSRPVAAIMDEARRMVDQGVREITLLGQNVNAFHGDAMDGTWGLARLIESLAEIDGLDRIRYTTSHPNDMNDDLIAVHGRIDKLMPYLHLPIQSGSDHILEKMNRKHGAKKYLDLIEKFRKARPDIAISSDFIVGFPGESESDFMATMDVVRAVTYASAYSFKYSPRPGTPAGAFEDQIPETVKTERLARLQELLNMQQTAFNMSKVGQILPVLFDRAGKRDGQLLGKTPYLQSLYIDHANPRIHGQILPVRVISATLNGLRGELDLIDDAISVPHPPPNQTEVFA